MLRRSIIPALAAIALLISMRGAETAYGLQPVKFTRGTVAGSGFSMSTPTTIAWGPDGRLYVANSNGALAALTLDATTKQITATQLIADASLGTACPALPAAQPDGCIQEIFGIAFDPADSSVPPPIYISNAISGFGGSGQAPAGSYPNKVTKISGAGYATRHDIITGLPASNSGHETNGLTFGPDGRLYIDSGSMTDAGLVNPNVGIFQRPEVPLSGAILVADIHAPTFDGAITYNPPNTYSDTVDQASGFDVSVYASGMRNPYDLLWHSNGKFYGTDNGPNKGYGFGSTSCTTATSYEPEAPDELNLILPNAYYGHPNRNRGRTDPRQCVYHPNTEPSNGAYTGPLETILSSSNGMVEYAAGTFGGQMRGDLVYVGWNPDDIHRVKLSPDGLSVVEDTQLDSGLNLPLDVTMGPDGTLYVAEYGGAKITFYKPDETPASAITITGISPVNSLVNGGVSVTITGTNFTATSDTTVTIGGVALQSMKVQNATTITGVAPPHAIGAVDVTVTNSVGTATLAGAFHYVASGGVLPPIANAGPDVSTPIAHENHAHVIIDGRASSDPDGVIVSYSWTEGGVVLSTNAVDSLQFELGTHLVTLTVTDDTGMTASDDVRIDVTLTAENPKPFYCFDENGDGKVNSTDLLQVAQQFGKHFGQAGYTRLKDWNMDRTINSIDLLGAAKDFTPGCPILDKQLRAATAGMEQYQNVNVAIAAGYVQVTPFIPGQGRHMIKGGVAGLATLDTIFDPAQPESLLYEPDPHTPGGWRLGGAMYVIPITQQPLVPDGFAGNEDAWHYHNGLCLWNGGNSVAQDTTQAWCMANSGSPVWIEKAGWLVHLWNYQPNWKGRFVEVSDKFVGIP